MHRSQAGLQKGSKRKVRTQFSQTLYQDHLEFKKKALFDRYTVNPQQKKVSSECKFNEKTNFGFSLQNEFLYVLLHLKNKDGRNILNVNIPEVCMFMDKAPYDIFYSQHGFIRGFKAAENSRCRLRDIIDVFREQWKVKNLAKFEHITAGFKEGQILLLSETDFVITCKKIKSDPIFKRLEFLQNKLPYVGQEIAATYDGLVQEKEMLKLATESLLGFRKQEDIERQLTREKYLEFLNQKIVLTLNYQHNIRVVKGTFHYVRNQSGQYFLINVSKLAVVNLTRAIQARQEKLKQREEERCKILILSAEKEKRYRSYEKPKQIKRYENAMKEGFERVVKDMNMLSITETKGEEIKNELAFRRLHPKIKQNYRQFITTGDFRKTKEKLFGCSVDNRKPISVPSKYVLRSYNKLKSSMRRCLTMNTQSSELAS